MIPPLRSPVGDRNGSVTHRLAAARPAGALFTTPMGRAAHRILVARFESRSRIPNATSPSKGSERVTESAFGAR